MAGSRPAPLPSSRRLRIIAQDPHVRDVTGKIITSVVDIPFEHLAQGPKGARVYVVDYDSSTGRFNPPSDLREELSEKEPSKDDLNKLAADPVFHAHNVYAVVMRTLARFEFALGRRLSWGFDGHQLHVAPHAFVDANAFYSNRDRGLFLGYFKMEDPDRKNATKTVYTCCSHDVVAHETTHALLDGLRTRFTEPSSAEQAAFHEGFADVVALLSIFSLPELVQKALDLKEQEDVGRRRGRTANAVSKKWLAREELKDGVLFGLGEEMADPNERINALRRSVKITPTEAKRIREEGEAHRLGELLVAAMMNAFLDVWLERLSSIGPVYGKDGMDRNRAAEEGRIAADQLLTMAIRAIDYMPTVDIHFRDFLSALLTADIEIQPNDRFNYRTKLLRNFALYGIQPTSKGFDGHAGVWEPPGYAMDYGNTVLDSMQRDPDEVFRFIWQNRERLAIYEPAYTRVQSVRPCIRISSAGFVLRETVAEYVQILNVRAHELESLPWDEPTYPPRRSSKPSEPVKPANMPGSLSFRLYGGGALIFSDRGELKYHVRNKILNSARQRERLLNLWTTGYFSTVGGGGQQFGGRRFADMHRLRRLGTPEPLTKETSYADSF
jgi:hypothetical protein